MPAGIKRAEGLDLTPMREHHVADLERCLSDVVEVLRKDETVKKIVLFGSYARGRRDLLTDLDIVLVVESDLPYLKRVERYWNEIAEYIIVDLDLFVYTKDELGTPVAREALRTGRVLYEKG
jgi:predicted nucleotidyltransferase